MAHSARIIGDCRKGKNAGGDHSLENFGYAAIFQLKLQPRPIRENKTLHNFEEKDSMRFHQSLDFERHRQSG